MREKFKKQKGITLIALIITIIVMLILAIVSINIIVNQGILTKSKTAVDEHQIAAEKEAIKIGYSEYIADKYSGKTPLELKVANAQVSEQTDEGWTITFNKTGNVYKLSADGKTITGHEKDLEEVAYLKKYMIGRGEDLVYSEQNNMYIKFTDDNGKDIKMDMISYIYDSSSAYVKYNNKIYKLILNKDKEKISDIILTYEPKGREGQKVTYSYDGTKEQEEEWTILYDNGDNIEIVSHSTIGNLTLGSSDTEAQGNNDFEKAVYSYNNAVSRINRYTSSLVTNTNKISVRSVGSNPNNPLSENTIMYTSENIKDWNCKYKDTEVRINGVGKGTDKNYEQDIVRMCYFGVLGVSSGSDYWLASRVVDDDDPCFLYYKIRYEMSYGRRL